MGLLPHKKALCRPLALVLTCALMCALGAGCQQTDEKHETTIFAMDTVMTLTVYGDGERIGGQEALDEMVETIYLLESRQDATREDSEIARLNQSGGEPVPLSGETADLLGQALALCALTGGALDITAYPAAETWGFTTGEYRVPSDTELEELAGRIDYTQVQLGSSGELLPTATLTSDAELDLGAVAKGYAGEQLAAYLERAGITSALLDLGQSTIVTLGSRPDGSPWRIGIQDPAGEGYLGVLELTDMAMGTSGGYQRYFEEDGVRYWHIIDPDTAAPARSGLASVTVVGPSGLTCDGLSTALFVMGLEEGTAFWRAHRSLDFDVLFITDDGAVFITSGLEDSFSLANGYENREVTVLS